MTFSVITITYQAERCLQRTLDSVSHQSYPHIEHLIIDGASTDQTVPMAQRYQKDSSYTVSVLSEPDNGLYDAMNKGLRRATGDYVVFLNAGDAFYSPDTLAKVAAAVASSSKGDGAGERSELPAVVYGDTAVTDAEGNFLHLRRHRPPEQLTWKSFRQGMLVCHQAFYVRRDIAQQFDYDMKYRHSADVDWCIRVMKEAQRRGLPLVNAHAVLANFEEGGDSKQHHRASLRERYQVMSVHYGTVQTFLLHCWFVVRALMGRSGTE